MGDMLSQEEINALLGGMNDSEDDDILSQLSDLPTDLDAALTDEEKDILGEVGNISMGTSATTLFALLNQKVLITTPRVRVQTWKEISDSYDRPCVGVRVDYTVGLKGSNILVLKQEDVKIICNLMMGGDGNVDPSEPLNEIDLSAIGEAMNQMVGSSSTSLSSMINMKIDIDTPKAFVLDFHNDVFTEQLGLEADEILVAISFRMEIGTLIDSNIMQILPVDFAKMMVENMKSKMMGMASAEPAKSKPSPAPAPQQPQQAQYQQPQYQQPTQPEYQQPSAAPYPQDPYGQYQAPPQYGPPQGQYAQAPYGQFGPPPQYGPMPQYAMPPYVQAPVAQPPQYSQPQANVNVSPVQFQNFDPSALAQQKENIDIIMDVPLEVTVELGRTKKKIREILEFSPGTVVELDKLAGEPIDILVNGKFIAKGEVVVIDENFAIRITDIISADKRI